jgi:hypothetical protein
MPPALAWSSSTAATTAPELRRYGLSVTGTPVDADLGTDAGTDVGVDAGTVMGADAGVGPGEAIAPERIAAAS